MTPSAGPSLVRRIVTLTWPVLVGQWAVMGYGVLDTIMTGHASATDLAALGIGNAVYYSVLVGGLGLVLALNPIIAQYFGAGNSRAIGESYVQGIWVALFTSLAGAATMAFPDVWLAFSDVSGPVHRQVVQYLQAMTFALPAVLLFRVVYALNTAVSRPKVVMVINLIGLALKVPLNYALIFGVWGAPELGATGCAIATVAVTWFTCGVGFLIVRHDSFYRQFGIRFALPRWTPIREILRIGVPTAVSYLVEITSFTFIALMIARLGAVTTGAHQIAGNLAGLCYSVPFGLSVAIATLIAQAIGAGNPREARRLISVGMGLALAAATCLAVVILLARGPLVAFYTSDPDVAAVALRLLVVAAFNHVADATQTVAGFALRAYKHAIAPMVVYCVSLWGLGLGGGYWFAFHGAFGVPPQGALGLWLAATLSLFIAGAALYLYLLRVAGRAISDAEASSLAERAALTPG